MNPETELKKLYNAAHLQFRVGGVYDIQVYVTHEPTEKPCSFSYVVDAVKITNEKQEFFEVL